MQWAGGERVEHAEIERNRTRGGSQGDIPGLQTVPIISSTNQTSSASLNETKSENY